MSSGEASDTLLSSGMETRRCVVLLMTSQHHCCDGLQPLLGERMLGGGGFINAYHFRGVKHMKVIQGISFSGQT